jgi:hypothetical protein
VREAIDVEIKHWLWRCKSAEPGGFAHQIDDVAAVWRKAAIR